MPEATHLTCTIYVKNFDEQCHLFGDGGFGFPLIREFGQPGGLRGRYYQTGAGFIEVVEEPSNPQSWWDFILSVDEVAHWKQKLEALGYPAGPIVEQGGNRQGFESQAPSGVRLRIRNLAGARDAPLVYTRKQNEPNVLHYIVSWWPEDWEADYEFLSKGLGLVTSRGRSQPGRRIAFMRAANGGRSILEILDRQNSPYQGEDMHWRLALMVDNAAAFHERLSAAGAGPTPLEKSRQGYDAFTVGTPSGPEVYVAQVPEGAMPGLLGDPIGLEAT